MDVYGALSRMTGNESKIFFAALRVKGMTRKAVAAALGRDGLSSFHDKQLAKMCESGLLEALQVPENNGAGFRRVYRVPRETRVIVARLASGKAS